MSRVLKENVWNREGYYEIARQGSKEEDHFGMQVLHRLAKDSQSILDLGCGEGTRLSILAAKGQKAVGIDVSKMGIKLARKSFPFFQFQVGNLEKLSLEDRSFDLVYSAYVLEHLDYPERMLGEAIRITTHGGHLVLIAPNYGAPNRSSPPFKGSRIKKLLRGFLNDYKNLIIRSRRLGWNKVNPIMAEEEYNIDWDVTVEPYIGTLITYLKEKGMLIEDVSSCWEEESKEAKKMQKVFRFLGGWGIFPFSLWGPHLVVVAEKP